MQYNSNLLYNFKILIRSFNFLIKRFSAQEIVLQIVPNYLSDTFSNNVCINAIMSTIFILPCTIVSSVIVLFLIMVCIVILLFQNFLNQMEGSLIVGLPFKWNKLENWKHNYILLCHVVSAINDCFGIVLLIELCYGFISFISLSFNIFYPKEITIQSIGMYCGFLLIEVVQLFLIMLSSFQLETEVIYMQHYPVCIYFIVIK